MQRYDNKYASGSWVTAAGAWAEQTAPRVSGDVTTFLSKARPSLFFHCVSVCGARETHYRRMDNVEWKVAMIAARRVDSDVLERTRPGISQERSSAHPLVIPTLTFCWLINNEAEAREEHRF